MKQTRLYQIFGDRVFHSCLWALDKRAVAGGLSLGLFVAFTPTIPFQMFLCTVGAILFGVNLFVALAACWVTNPVTALPVYLAARRLGLFFFNESKLLAYALDTFHLEGRGKLFIEQSLYLWAGALIFGLVAATIGNVMLRMGWTLLAGRRPNRNRGSAPAARQSPPDPELGE